MGISASDVVPFTQARATLKTDETNIEKAVIRSPINGVVLTRKVEPGQTVAAQMTTPVLYVIAEDLTKMELQVKVDEADVSAVKLGQPATFSVSAWPGRSFPATIQRVGLGSTTTDNVVTYKTVLSVANDDLALRPGRLTETDFAVACIGIPLLLEAARRALSTIGFRFAKRGHVMPDKQTRGYWGHSCDRPTRTHRHRQGGPTNNKPEPEQEEPETAPAFDAAALLAAL